MAFARFIPEAGQFMALVYIRHRVKDFSVWKEVFGDQRLARAHSGCTYERAFHIVQNSREIIVLLEWDSEQNAAAFLSSDELQRSMQNAGVEGKVEMQLLQEIDLSFGEEIPVSA